MKVKVKQTAIWYNGKYYPAGMEVDIPKADLSSLQLYVEVLEEKQVVVQPQVSEPQPVEVEADNAGDKK